MALTARPCHPSPRRCQGAGRAGRRALAVCRVCQHTASTSTASQHTASQHTASVCVCHVCHQGTMAHMAHTCARVGSVGSVCHYFRIEVARQTWKSYTIHTVIIYSIYITIKSSKCMTHLTHTRGFSESRITPAQMPTTSHTPTHTL